MPDTCAAWLAHLESIHPEAIALGLERVAQVRQRLRLQPQCPVIIVGGTNGKGSTCAMLEAILHAAGYQVGCYTSPHLLRYNERVRIGKREVDDARLCDAFERIEQARGGIPLTYFEFGTLAAMQCFIAAGVEVAILEVGLGGRLDAVNVFDADCAVVTSVDLDHTDYLGDTREQIAFEKAGIFRPGRVAVYGDPDMPQRIASEAARLGARLWRLGQEFGFELAAPEGSGQPGHWQYRGPGGVRHALPWPALRGSYQLHNASAALAVLDALRQRLPVAIEAVRRGLLEVQWPARFQVLPGRPQLILDVAHNPQAARALAENLAVQPCRGNTWAVFAMLRDKDRASVVAALRSQIQHWVVAGIDAPRGDTAENLAAVLAAAGITDWTCCATVTEALHLAQRQAGENDRIIALGSFYTIAEVMRALASDDG